MQELVGGRDTLAGPLQSYRTSYDDWLNEKEFEAGGGSFFIETPTLFICGVQDPFVPCAAAEGMELLFDDLEKHEVGTTHWIQIEAPEDVNVLIKSWLKKLEGGSKC